MSNTAGLQVRFSLEPRKVDGEWVNVEYIRLISMTDKFNSPHRPVESSDKVRFASQYDAWKKGLEAPPSGQPLKTWPGISPAEVNVLAQADIHTVEVLAEAPESVVGSDGPYRALQEAAQRYLELARSSAPMQALQAKAEASEREVVVLRERLAALESVTEKRRGPGRPPKHAVSEEA